MVGRGGGAVFWGGRARTSTAAAFPPHRQTFPQRLYNRLHKHVARALIRRVYEAHWKPVDAFVGAPRVGSPESAPRELVHMFNADWALEWCVCGGVGRWAGHSRASAPTADRLPPLTLQAAPAALQRAPGGRHASGQNERGAPRRFAGAGEGERGFRARARGPPTPHTPPTFRHWWTTRAGV